MPVCENCGQRTSRRRRGVILRIFSRASFHCRHCGANSHYYRAVFTIFERWCECPLCHNRQLTILSREDKIDSKSRNLARRMLRLFGFPIYHCTLCRFQFRDWRKLDPERDKPAARERWSALNERDLNTIAEDAPEG